MPTVLFAANDVAPSNILNIIADGERNSFGKFMKIGNGKGIPGDAVDRVKESDLVVLGMSCLPKNSEGEIEIAKKAMELNIPIALVADTFGVHRRPHFDFLRDYARMLFVVCDDDKAEASEMFPRTEVIVSGNPVWKDFFTPNMDREASVFLVGVGLNEKMILCPSGKDHIVNALHFNAVMEAVSNLLYYESFRIVLSIHPAIREDMQVYETFKKYSELNYYQIVISDEQASDLLPGTDLVVESVSTCGIEAACLQIPVINFWSDIAIRRMEESSGRASWPLVDVGASLVSLDYENLGKTINDLFDKEDLRSRLRNRQSELLFFINDQDPVEAMLKGINSLMPISA